MQTQESNKNLCISLPTAIKEKIDRLYQSTYNVTDLNKIYFLVYLINKKKSYQINNRNHAWMLSFKCGEVSNILSRLESNKIIKLDKEFEISKRSNTYSLVSPYDYKTTDCYRLNYYVGQIKFPMWVQRFVADGGLVKNASTTNWVKQDLIKSKEIAENKDKIQIESLKILVNELQGKIKALEAELNTLQPSSNGKESNALPPVETQSDGLKLVNAKGEDFTVINGSNFSSHVIEQLKNRYKKTCTHLIVKDNNNQIRFQHDLLNSTLRQQILIAC